MFEPAPILEAVGVMLAEADERAAARLDEMQGEVLRRLDERLAQLPPPEAAEPGAPGRDGVDRILALPRYVQNGESCEANTVAWWNAGIWQSVRVTSGNPADDPPGWKCLVPGVASIETAEDFTRRELVIGLRMSDGTLHECRGRMPATQLPPDYRERGWGVLAGDTLRDEAGEVERMALVDGAGQLFPDDCWREYRIRGFRGQKGKPGDPGDPGPPGPGLQGLGLANDPETGRLAIVPRFADPKAKSEPILVDLLTSEPAGDRLAITCWAGRWNAGRTYARGDVVNAGGGALFISLRSDNNAQPKDGKAWEAMTDAA